MRICLAPVMIVLSKAARTRINALPPHPWLLPLKAPRLPATFRPRAKRFDAVSEQFDEDRDAPSDSLHKERPAEANDAYASHRPLGKGDAETEAALRYEQNGMLRMQARRDSLVEKGDPAVTEVDNPEEASSAFQSWRTREIRNYLVANIDTHATDHSTIMTNPEHAEKALAYDVAVGVCTIRQEELHDLRVAADWTLLGLLDNTQDSAEFFEYFNSGRFKNVSLFEWANNEKSPARKPAKIIDERQNSAGPASPTGISALGTDDA